jgi:hypothetical protein
MRRTFTINQHTTVTVEELAVAGDVLRFTTTACEASGSGAIALRDITAVTLDLTNEVLLQGNRVSWEVQVQLTNAAVWRFLVTHPDDDTDALYEAVQDTYDAVVAHLGDGTG